MVRMWELFCGVRVWGSCVGEGGAFVWSEVGGLLCGVRVGALVWSEGGGLLCGVRAGTLVWVEGEGASCVE